MHIECCQHIAAAIHDEINDDHDDDEGVYEREDEKKRKMVNKNNFPLYMCRYKCSCINESTCGYNEIKL